MVNAQMGGPAVGSCHISSTCTDSQADVILDVTFDDCCSDLSRTTFRSSGFDDNNVQSNDPPFVPGPAGCLLCPIGNCMEASYRR